MAPDYQPKDYWSERLGREFTLRGVGHAAYSRRYNDWVYRRKSDMLMEALAARRGGSALDIGSGIGWVVEQLSRRGLKVEGCDITDIAVRLLADRFPEMSFFQASVGESPIPRDAASFDVVTMLDVAYHMTDYRLWETAIRDIGRVLKPGGVLIVTDRLGDQPSRPAAHVQFRSRDEWDQAAESAGMRVERVEALYTWLCRPPNVPGFRWLPGAVRGPIEYLLDDHFAAVRPHLRWAVCVKAAA